MRVPTLLIGLAWVTAGAWSQAQESSAGDPEEVEVYTKAIAALVGAPDAAGVFYLAERIVTEGGRPLSSSSPEQVSEELEAAGYAVELAELAENGLWQVPRTSLFIMLRPVEFWPGRKIVVFTVYVGSGPTDLKEVAFKFRKEADRGWVLIEKGPAESGS